MLFTVDNINLVKEVQKRPCLYDKSDSKYGVQREMNKAWTQIGKKVGWTGAVCKDKWRNLRISFIRHLKLHAFGMQPKPYYLLEHMRFLTPFLKGQHIPREDASSYTSEDEDAGDPLEEEHIDEDPLQSQIKIDECKTEPDSHSEINNLHSEINIIECKTEPDSDSEINNRREEYEIVDNEDLPTTTKRKKPNEEEEQNDNTNLTHFSKRDTSEFETPNDPIKSFLDSLDPELREMNTQQFKSFKRKVLVLIDSIMDSDKTNATSSKDN